MCGTMVQIRTIFAISFVQRFCIHDINSITLANAYNVKELRRGQLS